ncbi:MAG TPA: NAD-dependent malic enzyme [Pseudonocardia sp.]|jgi:malate dehydrogenase (oxaloacetate-decarboxylating)|nr:NAD-dependent malic enzyme [Pseudonocardia sp.]
MYQQPYELVTTADGVVARVHARGNAVLSSPTINRGTAFTHEERRALGLTGLLPTEVSTLSSQVSRVYAQFRDQVGDLQKWGYLAALRDRNEVLFYRLLSEHLAEMLPIIYTPTVGVAIERFSHEFRRPRRGIYLSVDHPEDIETALRNSGLGPADVDLIVATDSEGILGIGDQGVGGIEIAIGKLAVYTAAAGIHPHRVLPVVLDTGTDNPALLADDMYLGERHPRVRDHRYDEFIEAYVRAASKLFPDAMLHWEDFGAGNARRILNRYAEQVCTFNDDMQGTAAVVLAAAFAAVRAAGTTIAEQRVVIHGSGTAGLGIADMMRDVMIREGVPPEEVTGRFFALGSRGLLVDDDPRLRDFQVPYARGAAEVAGWNRGPNGEIGLAEVVARVRPTMLIGTSAQAGAFTEEIITRMAAHVERPIVMPLSNPTSKCEALPADVVRWTDGRALIATGSPFPPVVHDGATIHIAQANNALVFPGLGLGVTVAKARRITEPMIMAAAEAVAGIAGDHSPGAPLLPSVDRLRPVSEAVAVAVAVEAEQQGLAQVPLPDPRRQVHEAMWRPEYPRLEVTEL